MHGYLLTVRTLASVHSDLFRGNTHDTIQHALFDRLWIMTEEKISCGVKAEYMQLATVIHQREALPADAKECLLRVAIGLLTTSLHSIDAMIPLLLQVCLPPSKT